MAIRDEIDVPLLSSIAAAGVMLLLVTVIGTQGFFYYYENRLIAKRIDEGVSRPTEEIAITRKQLAEIDSPERFAYLNAEKSLVRLPISQAKKVLIANGGIVPSTQPSK